MRFKKILESISALLISGIILSLFAFTACGGDSSGGGANGPVYDPIDTSYAKTMSGGDAVTISGFNGTNIYALVSFIPGDKRESDSAPTTSSDWTLTSAAGKSMSSDAVNILFKRYNVNLSRKMVYSSGQTDIDLRMRQSENNAFANKTRQFSKKIYGRNSRVPSSIVVGTTWNNIRMVATDSLTYISATCRKVSTYAYFFVDNRDTAAMSSYLDDYATAFDLIYAVNHAKFGNENDVDVNDKVIIIFSSELELVTGLLGYFYSADKFAYDSVDNPYSNEGDIFYMSTKSTFQGDTIKATLAHEFQHMIYFDEHYNRGVQNTYTWLNEALSQAAEYYNGFLTNHEDWINGFLDYGWGSLSLTHWTSNNYGYGAIFIRYLIDQYGDTAIKNMCSTNKVGVAAVESATGEDFNTIFYNFTLALAMSGTGDTTDPKYNFTTLNLLTVQPNGRGGLIPYTGTYAPVVAGSGLSSWNYPYEIFFIAGSGTFNTMTLDGSEVIGTAFGLSQ